MAVKLWKRAFIDDYARWAVSLSGGLLQAFIVGARLAGFSCYLLVLLYRGSFKDPVVPRVVTTF